MDHCTGRAQNLVTRTETLAQRRQDTDRIEPLVGVRPDLLDAIEQLQRRVSALTVARLQWHARGRQGVW